MSSGIAAVNHQIEKARSEIAKVDDTEENILKVYRYVLNMKPPKSIVKHNEFGGFDYIPITLVERLFDGLFPGWTEEILREGTVANGFYTVVRITLPVAHTSKAIVASGIGAAEFQTRKGAGTSDFSNLMPGAIVTAVPKAKSEAVKNAAKKLGDLFGRSISRDDDNSENEYQIVNLSRNKIANTLKSEKGDDEKN